MNTPANNKFAELLPVSSKPPRNPGELAGLNLRNQLRGPLNWMLPLFLFFAFGFPIFAYLIMRETLPAFQEMSVVAGRALAVSKSPSLPGAYQETNEGNRTYQEYSVVKYSFRVGGITHYGASIVSQQSPYAVVKPGAPLPIMYAPKNLSINVLEGTQQEVPWAAFLFMPPFFALFFVVMFVPAYAPAMRQTLQARRIYKRGEITTGNVRFVAKKRGGGMYGNIASRFEILYSFKGADGETQEGKQLCDNEWLVQRLDVGDELTIVYLPKTSHQSIVVEPFIE